MNLKAVITFLIFIILNQVSIESLKAQRIMENLDRGAIAVKVDNGVFISWRLLASDSQNVSFNIYRNNLKLNNKPLKQSTN